MDYFGLIQKAVDRIEEHLDERLQICDLARAAYCSDAHFSRVFRAIVGLSVMEYVRCRRLSLAGRELSLTREKIVDIALKYGYETPEAFTKAFKRFHGMTPIACRKSGTSKYLERSFPLVNKMKMLEGYNMNNFGSPLQQILDDLDKKSANLYFCFTVRGERFAIPALQVNEITYAKYLHINPEGSLYLFQRGHVLPVIRLNESIGFDEIKTERWNVLYCYENKKPEYPRPVSFEPIAHENGNFGLAVEGNPELKIPRAIKAASNPKHTFISQVGQFEDGEANIIQSGELLRAMSHQIVGSFDKPDCIPENQQPTGNIQKRLELAAYEAELLARNASIEAAGGMEYHKGTMVVAYELHHLARELAKIASEMRKD